MLNILISLPIWGWKYSCIILKFLKCRFRFSMCWGINVHWTFDFTPDHVRIASEQRFRFGHKSFYLFGIRSCLGASHKQILKTQFNMTSSCIFGFRATRPAMESHNFLTWLFIIMWCGFSSLWGVASSLCGVVSSLCLVVSSLWLIVTSLCLVVTSLCLVVSSLCLVVTSLCLVVTLSCLVVTSLCLVVTSLCLVVTSLCLVVTSLCLVVTSFCLVVTSLCGLFIMWCGLVFKFCWLNSLPVRSPSTQILLVTRN